MAARYTRDAADLAWGGEEYVDQPAESRVPDDDDDDDEDDKDDLELAQVDSQGGDSEAKYGLLTDPVTGEEIVKCTQCSFAGPASSFPLRLNGTGHVRTCVKHTKPRRVAPKPSLTTYETVTWDTLLEDVRNQSTGTIEIDRFVTLDPDHPGACGETLLARANMIMDGIKTSAGYRFNYKRRQDSTQKEEKSTVFTYYCAQLEGEQTRHVLHPDESKRRPKKLPKIPRFHCNGWASITVSESMPTTARVRLTHAFAHIAVFSKRAAGAGVGTASSLLPTHSTATLMAAVAAAASGDEIGSAGGSQSPIASFEGFAGVVASGPAEPMGAASRRPVRKRKRPSSDGIDGAEGDTEPGSPSEVLRLIAGEDPNASAVSLMDLAGAGPSNQNWPPVNHGHHHQQHHQQLPPQAQGAKVYFPPQYLAEVKRKVQIAFAEAERDGGLTIDEARAFETAFAPLSQLGHEIEMRNGAEVGVGANIDPELRTG